MSITTRTTTVKKKPASPGIPNTTVDLYDSNLNMVAHHDDRLERLLPVQRSGVRQLHRREEPPPGYLDGKDSVGSAGGMLVAAGRYLEYLVTDTTNAQNYNFGELLPASISGMVHVDMNGDCIYEPGEPLLAGVTDSIVDSSTRSSRPPRPIRTANTSSPTSQPFATYTVHEVQPAGYFEFGDTVGSAGGTLQGLDTIAGATLGSGVNATDYDFCVQAPARSRAWSTSTLNGDCIYEPGEPLLAGVTIQLLDSTIRWSPPRSPTRTASTSSPDLRPARIRFTKCNRRATSNSAIALVRRAARYKGWTRSPRRARLGRERHGLRLLRAGTGLDLGHGPRRPERRLHLRAGRAVVGGRHRAVNQLVRTRSSPPP